MSSPSACGPVRFKRSPAKKRRPSRGGYFARREGPQPADIVAEMHAAGLEFFIASDQNRKAFRYAYRVRPDGDGDRCRKLLEQVKADEDLRALVRVEIFAALVREAMGLPARPKAVAA